MSDLISRKALVAALIKEREKFPPETAERYSFGVKLPNRFNQAIRGGIRKALRLVETAPGIDAIEIVRCEHCKYYDICQYDGVSGGDDDYCAAGERGKEEEDE